MGTIQNSEYQTWVNRLNALRTKHGLAQTSVAAPGNVKITATKMNELLSNMTMSSKWLSSSLSDRVAANAQIQLAIATKIGSTLTSWESVCVNNSAFFTAFFTSNKTANFTVFGAHKANCAHFGSHFNENSSDFDHFSEFSNFEDYSSFFSGHNSNNTVFIGFQCNAWNGAFWSPNFSDFNSDFDSD